MSTSPQAGAPAVEHGAQQQNYITPEVQALMDTEAGPFAAWDPVERGAVRRFAQAIMDDDPVYWDDEYAASTRYGRVIAPPLFPMYAFRRAPGTPDPLNGAADPDFDGAVDNFVVWFGLPPLPINLRRLLNGGNRVRFSRYAEIGDRVSATSRYVSVTQKQGKDGPIVFVVIEVTFRNQRDDVLATCEQTLIWR